ncbi:MAG: hypothetical protein LBC67_03250 [Spirochaetales bacterium]|jgi:hypothetical protein|nr:hypothetical protein [Spirochaetales bacterium]
MKRIFAASLIFVFFGAFGVGLFAQNLLDNPDYKKGLEFQAMAQGAYDEGDYDLSVEYSAQAQDYFQRAKDYAERMALRYAASNFKKRAQERLKYADAINAASNYPEEYGPALDAFRAADTSFSQEDYELSIKGYKTTLELLKNIAPAVAEPKAELARAQELRGIIAEYGFAALRPSEMQRGDTAYDMGSSLMGRENARAKQLLTDAITNYQLVIDGAVAALAASRRAEVDAAKKAADEADAAVLAPEEYAQAQASHYSAEKELQSGNYSKAWNDSQEAILAYGRASAAGGALPEYYTVRFIPSRRDCLWHIAGYDFVYADPGKWRLLYDANKHLLQDPANPSLIQPGLKIRIPSQSGEKRSGEWKEKE